MTPRDVDQLTHTEYRAFVDYQNQQIRAEQRAARKRG
jgi:hypothetical protein